MMKLNLKRKVGFLVIYILSIGIILIGVKFTGLITRAQQKSASGRIFLENDTCIVSRNEAHNIPLIYIITPTKQRNEQKADLTRLSHTLRLVPRINWILVEDRDTKSDLVKTFLKESALNYTHLAIKTSDTEYRELQKEGKIKPGSPPAKGVHQRNLALDWITKYGEHPSVFYFADDDNTYDLKLFEEMRFTKKVSVWPVGLIGFSRFQAPIVREGKVVGFAAGWIAGRKFPVDMAAFAVNSEILKRSNPPRFDHNVMRGQAETSFVEQLNVTIAELEPRADNCTKVLVWHTRTKKSPMSSTSTLKGRLAKYNLTLYDFEI